MTLISINYLAFLFFAVAGFHLLPEILRKGFLALVSLLFISLVDLNSALILICSTAFTFYLAKKVPFHFGRIFLGLGILGHLGLLIFAKWTFYAEGVDVIESGIQSTGTLFLGLSYYALQNIAYLLSVYQRKLDPSECAVDLLLYNAFFPRVLSGPIESFKSISKQLNDKSKNGSRLTIFKGIQRISMGFFKKLVFADRLAPMVENVFISNNTNQALLIALGCALFTVQLYLDFSAYMDVAIGSAGLFGIRLSENFNLPLRSTSISELWRRWHITLIEWLTVHLFYPMVYAFRKQRKWGVAFSLLFVFLLSGLWHGIAWTYVCWALWNALCLLYELKSKQLRGSWAQSIHKGTYWVFSVGLTFLAFSFGLLFFRSNSMEQAGQMVKCLLFEIRIPASMYHDVIAPLFGSGTQEVVFNSLLMLLLLTLFLAIEKWVNDYFFQDSFRPVGLFCMLILIFLFGTFDSGQTFIYHQY